MSSDPAEKLGYFYNTILAAATLLWQKGLYSNYLENVRDILLWGQIYGEHKCSRDSDVKIMNV